MFEKLKYIYNFIKLDLEERKKYFMNSRYEISSLEEKIERFEGFSQTNFHNLIERCRSFLITSRDDKLYVETVKDKIITLTLEKEALIEKTKATIEDLKNDNLKLLKKIEKLKEETELNQLEKNELLRRTDEINKRAHENNLLKAELDKSKSLMKKEKTKISFTKDQEIFQLHEKLKYSSKFEKNFREEEKEKFKLKHICNELKLELNRLSTVKSF